MHQTVGERSGLWICSMRPRLQMLTLTHFLYCISLLTLHFVFLCSFAVVLKS